MCFADINIPTQIGNSIDWQSISSGDFTVHAIKNNGTLWGWGRNAYGEAGVTVISNTPTQVDTLTNWKFVSSGGNISYALKNDSTLWSTGWGVGGSLGNGTLNTTSPFFLQVTSTNCSVLEVTQNNNILENVKIYPNPSNGKLYIEFRDYNENSSIEIYSLIGQKVMEQLKLKDSLICVSNLESGIYIVKITQSDKTVIKKIVIE